MFSDDVIGTLGLYCSAFIALLLGLKGSILNAPADPTNGATKSGSDKPKVSLGIITTGY